MEQANPLPLREVIQIFQREVTAALDGINNTGQGIVWNPERVTLSLDVVFDDAGIPRARIRSSESKEPETGHRLTVEFRLQHVDVSTGGGEEPVMPRVQIAGGTNHDLATRRDQSEPDVNPAYADLQTILGEPGFDSSARAAVFCEALQKLSRDQALGLCRALTSPAAEVDDETLRRARHQILGIIRSGSLKSPERAAAILSRLIERWPVASLLRFVADRWKTSDTWERF